MRAVALFGSILVLAAGSLASGQSAAVPTVVFVCEHGAAKSVVAAAHFNKLAAGRGLPMRAVSRGTAPDASVPALIRDGLQGERLLLDAGFTPTRVSAADVRAAAQVVTFDVTLPVDAQPAALAKWDALPAFSDGYSPASAAIAAKVEALLRDIAPRQEASETVVLTVSGMT